MSFGIETVRLTVPHSAVQVLVRMWLMMPLSTGRVTRKVQAAGANLHVLSECVGSQLQYALRLYLEEEGAPLLNNVALPPMPAKLAC